MGEFLEIAKVMVQPTMKLLDMCGSAIGTMYEPRHIRNLADAEAYKIKQLSTAITESDNLPIAYKNGDISMSTVNFEDFAKRAEFRTKYQLLREQKNIESVVGKAYQELLNAPEVVNDPVDEDWSARFFNIVKEINTEEMQHIWSKILAGEITNPGNFSMRTLETIRNITRDEAAAFQRIIPCIVHSGSDMFITSSNDIYEKYGISYTDILQLDECGLMVSSGTLTLTQTIQEENRIFIWTDDRAMISSASPEQPCKISYGIHTLTRAGKELFSILNHAPNNDYFMDFAEHIFRKNKTATVQIHRINSIEGNTANYDREALRIFKHT